MYVHFDGSVVVIVVGDPVCPFCWLVGRLGDWLVSRLGDLLVSMPLFYKGGKLHFHAPIERLFLPLTLVLMAEGFSQLAMSLSSDSNFSFSLLFFSVRIEMKFRYGISRLFPRFSSPFPDFFPITFNTNWFSLNLLLLECSILSFIQFCFPISIFIEELPSEAGGFMNIYNMRDGAREREREKVCVKGR